MPWHHRLREWLRRNFGTRRRAPTLEELHLRAQVARLQVQLDERDADMKQLRADLNAERATIPLQKMELDDLLLLRERTRSLWKADLEVEARRVAGQQK